MFRRTRIAVLILSLAVLAVGCGDDDDDPAGDSGTTAPSEEEASCPAALPTEGGGHAHGRHRRAGLRAVGGRATTRPTARASRAPSPTRWPRSSASRKDDVDLDPHRLRRGHRPGRRRTTTSTSSSTRSPPSGTRSSTSPTATTRSSRRSSAGRTAPIADATSLEDLKGAQLGAAIGTTSLDYIEEVIQPDSEALVFDDNAAAKAAFDANQVDGIVFDLPTAYYITVGRDPRLRRSSACCPQQGEAEELGMLFETAARSSRA